MILFKFFKKNNLQIFRFIISGGIASTLNYLIYVFLYFIFENIIFASLSGYFAGLLISFIFSKLWVFKTSFQYKMTKSFSVFCLIYFVGGLEMSIVIIVANQFINNHQIAWFFGALIGSLNNYFGSKYLLFRK